MDAQCSSSNPDTSKIEDIPLQSMAPIRCYGLREKQTSRDTSFDGTSIKTDNTSIEPNNRSLATNDTIDLGGGEYNGTENIQSDKDIVHDSSGAVNTTGFEGTSFKNILLNLIYNY